MLVDHCDNCLGALDSCECSVYAGTQGYESVLVGRAHLNHCHVAGQSTATVQFLGLAQVHGNVVCISCLNTLAHVGAYEECLVEKDAGIFLVGVGCGTFCVKVVDKHILQFTCVCTAAESLDENLRSAGHRAEMDVIAALYDLDGFVRADKLDFLVHLF